METNFNYEILKLVFKYSIIHNTDMLSEYPSKSGLFIPVKENPRLTSVESAVVRVYDENGPLATGFILDEEGLKFVTAAQVFADNPNTMRRRIIFARYLFACGNTSR